MDDGSGMEGAMEVSVKECGGGAEVEDIGEL